MWATVKNNNKTLSAAKSQRGLSRRDYEPGNDSNTGNLTSRMSLLALLVLCAALMGITKTASSESESQSENENETADNAQLSISQDSIDFGRWMPGDNFTRKLSLTNRGSDGAAAVTISNLFLDELDEKSFSTNFKGPVEIAAGETLAIEISYSPVTPGKTTGFLFLTHSLGTATIHLSGFGMPGRYDTVALKDQLPLQELRAAPSFGKSVLPGIGNISPTSLQFGPDDRLYVATLDGGIKIYTVKRNSANKYVVTDTDTLNHVKNIPNHNDDGKANNNLKSRLVTGLLVTGTPNSPIIYVTSSDPRVGGGANGNSSNLDTNSSVLSRLTKNGNNWLKKDLVRGMPRSEENHTANGLAINPAGDKIYIAMGGNTNQGAPSNNFAKLPEYALSAAILEIDLAQIGNNTYDLPTLNDEDRPGINDANDPFGGNRGKNQAKIVTNGPVKVYAPGFRNPYDIVIAESGKMYTWDNGSNAGWGNEPVGEGTNGNCSNAVNEPGDTRYDALHLVTGAGYYGGHPNPTRGNKNNKFNNSNPQSPVPASNSVECQFRGAQGNNSGKHFLNKSLTYVPSSTNGLVEYTATNFGGALQGDLLAAAFNNKIYRVQLNNTGTKATSNTALFSNVGNKPLDVTAVGDFGLFPGTIWVADFADKDIYVFEPVDYQGTNTAGTCNPASSSFDADGDGFSNADENANSTDPCSAADIPADADGDFVSDLTDADDDNDGIDDLVDPFALDEFNGANTPLGTVYDWENNSPTAPFIAGLGFSGLMTNGSTNYLDQFDLDQMTISGAAGVVTVDTVPKGDPLRDLNTQEFAFQFGVNVGPSSPTFRARTRILAPFAGITAERFQSMGLFIGTGDQDNYIKLVVTANGNEGGLEFAKELNADFALSKRHQDSIVNAEWVDLIIEVDPATNTAKPLYQIKINGQVGPIKAFANSTSFPSSWLTGNTKLAVGIISTSFAAPTFSVTWDLIEVMPVFSGVSNQPPIVNAGNDKSVTLPASTTLTATVIDDGLPSGLLSHSWSKLSGPGSVNFSNPDSLNTIASFSQAGTYVLQLAATDTALPGIDDITIYVAGGNDTGSAPNNNIPENFVALEAENYKSNNAAGQHSWVSSNLSGTSGTAAMVTTPNTGTIKFGSAGSPNLNYSVNFPAAGTYYVWVRGWGDTNSQGEGKNDSLHLGLNGSLQASADKIDQFPASGWTWSNSTRDPAVATLSISKAGTQTVNLWMREDGLAVDRIEFTTDITYVPTGTGTEDSATTPPAVPSNQAPVVEAGSDRVISSGSTITLNGNVDDDGLPGTALSVLWTQVSGPSGVSFASPANVTTDASFELAGTYTLQLLASDGQLSDTDTLVVTVSSVDNGDNSDGTDSDSDTDSDTDDNSDDASDSGSDNSNDSDTGDSNKQPAIRINVGGPAVSANGQTWIADNPGSHDFVNTGRTHSYPQNIDVSSLSANTPATLFNTERWDPPAGLAMNWDIPLVPGQYEVRLYFSENFGRTQATGARVFSVEIEGIQVLSALDVFSIAGADKALMESFTVNSDDNLDIDFGHLVENPAIKAIEILPL